MRKSGWALVAIVLSTALGLTASGSQFATASSPGTAEAASPTVQLEMSTRKTWGFNFDASYVMSVDAGGAKVDPRLNIPLTDAESADLDTRAKVTTGAEEITKALRLNDRFGGVFVDNAAGGIAKIWLANPSATERDLITRLLPGGAKVDFLVTTYSLAQLQTDYENVASHAAQFADEGIVVSYAIRDMPSNRVAIFMSPGTADADVQKVLALGPSLVLGGMQTVSTEYSRSTSDGRDYAGRAIQADSPSRDRDGQVAGCTSSTSARNGTAYYLITAGHCLRPNQNEYLGNPQATHVAAKAIGVGRIKNQFYQQSRTACDCTLVGPIPQGDATNQVFVNGSGGLYPYSNVADPRPGDPACMSGYESAWRITSGDIICGTVQAYSGYTATRDDGSHLYVDAYPWYGNGGLQGIGGDSGAPLGNGASFEGVLSGGNSSVTFFTKSTLISAATDGTPIFGNP